MIKNKGQHTAVQWLALALHNKKAQLDLSVRCLNVLNMFE